VFQPRGSNTRAIIANSVRDVSLWRVLEFIARNPRAFRFFHPRLIARKNYRLIN
jgi:hypothetical protein